MKHYRLLTLLGLLIMFLPGISHGQTYQGPSGGSGGETFDYWMPRKNPRIRAVIVSYSNVIRCIAFRYDNSGDSIHTQYTERSLSQGCRLPRSEYKETRIDFAPDEFIVGIEGRYGTAIDSIRFYTNKSSPPPIGGSGGVVQFGYTAPAGQKIISFFGRAGNNLDAIGVMYGPIN